MDLIYTGYADSASATPYTPLAQAHVMYYVLCTCTMFDVLCTMYNVLCTMYCVLYTVYDIRYTIYYILYTIYYILYTILTFFHLAVQIFFDPRRSVRELERRASGRGNPP